MTPVIGFDQNRLDPRVHDRELMRTTRFDLVSSFFSAWIVMLAAIVTVLLLLWLVSSVTSPAPTNRPATMVSSASIAVGDPEFEIPAAEEVVDLASSTLREVLDEVDEVSFVVARGQPAEVMTRAVSGHTGPRGDRGLDLRGTDIVRRHQRWVLNFRAASRSAYARELDFHGIELGVFGGGLAGLDFASNLAVDPNSRHLEDPSGERRLYFSWVRPSPLAAYEAELLGRAGIVTAGRQIVKFIPLGLENRLAMMELEYAHSKGVSTVTAIAKTVFRSEPTGAGFRFRVIAQRYRRQSPSLVSGEPKT